MVFQIPLTDFGSGHLDIYLNYVLFISLEIIKEWKRQWFNKRKKKTVRYYRRGS